MALVAYLVKCPWEKSECEFMSHWDKNLLIQNGPYCHKKWWPKIITSQN